MNPADWIIDLVLAYWKARALADLGPERTCSACTGRQHDRSRGDSVRLQIRTLRPPRLDVGGVGQ